MTFPRHALLFLSSVVFEQSYLLWPKKDMFKKKLGKKSNLRRRNNEDDGDDDQSSNGSGNGADDPSSTHAQIQQKKKRRMVLESLQYRKGVSATKLLQNNPTEKLFLDQQVDESTSDDPNKREGVLEQKHRLAMEEYIEENLGTSGITNKEDALDTRKDGSGLNATEKLYAQLSEASARLAGRSTESKSIDADIGAGGGLAAGTGLAEVVLPLEERLASLEATARAARKQPLSDTDMMKRLPSSKPLSSNPGPSRFSAPSRQKVLHDTPIEQKELVMEDSTEDVADSDRVGFQAFRRQQTGETGSRHPNNSHGRGGYHATDDRAFKNFVTKQRERRQNR